MDNVVDSMLDTLIVANPDFTIRRVNQSAIDMLEYSQKELMGQSIENIIFTEKMKPIYTVLYPSERGYGSDIHISNYYISIS